MCFFQFPSPQKILKHSHIWECAHPRSSDLQVGSGCFILLHWGLPTVDSPLEPPQKGSMGSGGSPVCPSEGLDMAGSPWRKE